MIFLWIAIAIVVFLLIKYGNKIKITGRPINNTTVSISTPSPKKNNWLGIIGGVIGVIIGICILVFTVSYAWSFASSFFEKKVSTENIVKVGKTKTLYQFADTNWDRSVLVSSNADFYPKGGKVKVTTPSKKFYISTPGTSELRQKENAGKFFFEPSDLAAWGIEVWQ